ncbi:MAG: ornithine cyclodeaminase family protein [Candidatus Methanolliviera hydrocarbonicum]|uniref:Alanine dehydrogenase n=1 Tax=Candidatus Methanolliviera hydrocarbonicum TaxID=2491085 RepID=A0A520KVL3_9EURY|nr:MAG: ornithine cyclodeaminase family protein [Candidatus Methanolliviera hydrocarbonicum]
MIFLCREDIEKIFKMEDALNAVEEAYIAHAHGEIVMPPKMDLHLDKGLLRYMPAYVRSIDSAGEKIVNIHPQNPRESSLPTVMALIVINNPATGEPIAVMDGTYITAMRTGAAGGISAKYLSRKDASVVGMVGAGVQARGQLMALIQVRNISEVKVYDMYRDASERFAREVGETLDIQITTVESAKEAVVGSDIVVTTTTSRKPVVMNEWVDIGTHVCAVGADTPGKRELDLSLLKRGKIVVDDVSQSTTIGELNIPYRDGLIELEEIYGEIGEIIIGRKEGREAEDEITIFDTSGLAAQDIISAHHILNDAKRKKIGLEMKVF